MQKYGFLFIYWFDISQIQWFFQIFCLPFTEVAIVTKAWIQENLKLT